MNNSKFYRNLFIALGVVVFVTEMICASQIIQLWHNEGFNEALDFAQLCGTLHVFAAGLGCFFACLDARP